MAHQRRVVVEREIGACIKKVGFKAVGVMRSAERDTGGKGWLDALPMELLAGEEQPG